VSGQPHVPTALPATNNCGHPFNTRLIGLQSNWTFRRK